MEELVQTVCVNLLKQREKSPFFECAGEKSSWTHDFMRELESSSFLERCCKKKKKTEAVLHHTRELLDEVNPALGQCIKEL